MTVRDCIGVVVAENVMAPLRSYQRVKPGDEEDLKSAVALMGPISMAADVQHNTFRVRGYKYQWHYMIFSSFPLLPFPPLLSSLLHSSPLPSPFQFYQRGVYDEPNCSTRKLTHAMLIVGYGRCYGKEFWLVKNR